MLFNSLTFIVFLPLVLALYHLLPHRGQNRMLLLASYVFYGWWDVRFLFLIIASTLVDYVCGLMIGRGRLTARQQVNVSLSAVGATWFFLCLPWKQLQFARNGASWEAIDWGQFFALDGGDLSLLLAAIAAMSILHTLVTFGARLKRDHRRRLFLIVSVVANLGILAVFKYFDFFIDSAEDALRHLGLNAEMARLNIVLPVGISFYTFQTMSYTIDVYRAQMRPTRRLLDLALFVAYFPQLVAGPIERAARLLPVLQAPRRIALHQVTRGLHLILFGFFKKVVIADGVAASVVSVYGSAAPASAIDIALATGLFALQIYCDFSGYSDIARGTSKLFGIDLMVNFNLPYFSRSPSEFWQRWHISLSSWLRDYLYIPLGGNRGGTARTCRNLMLTMGLGGLWHGAAWNFVLWGVYQGAILCAFRAFSRRNSLPPSIALHRPALLRLISGAIKIGLFFLITCYGWLLFRANSFDQIVQMTGALLRLDGGLTVSVDRPTLAALAGIPLLLLLDAWQYAAGDEHMYRRLPTPLRGLLYAALIFLIVMGTSHEPAQFIYFQF